MPVKRRHVEAVGLNVGDEIIDTPGRIPASTIQTISGSEMRSAVQLVRLSIASQLNCGELT